MKKEYTWIMKNFSSFEGQLRYNELFEHCMTQTSKTTRIMSDLLKLYTDKDLRLIKYFYSEQEEWILPITIFPLFSYNKNKMDLCYKEFSMSSELEEELRKILTSYIVRLDMPKLDIPASDCLGKLGNQKFNDLGVVKYDYERATSISDISFLYQVFMTKNLSPREVWLPSKIIKYNNAFLMRVFGQLLRKDKAYPPLEIEDVKKQVLKDEKSGNYYHFDLPGYGFQYPRQILRVCAEVVEELYPCTELSEQCTLFYKILEECKIRLPGGRVVRPPRGIGLGYYEDLKTLCILAILWNKFEPISVYGDQGLMSTSNILFKEELERFGFLYKPGPIDIFTDCYKDDGEDRGLIWAGVRFTSKKAVKPREFSTDFLEAIFQEEHWERKNGLRSLAMRRPKLYEKHFLEICFFYKYLYGYEFYPNEQTFHFDNGGLSINNRLVGLSKLYNLRAFSTPEDELEKDLRFTSPFLVGRRRRPPVKESRLFSKKRKELYRKNSALDTQLYDFLYPLLSYNKKDIVTPPSIPRWADYQQIVMHQLTSGSFTCGLVGEEIMKAVYYQHFSPDPFRARATGGYSLKLSGALLARLLPSL